MKHVVRWLAVLAVLLAQPAVVYSQTTGNAAPVWRQQFLDASGDPLSGCLINTYLGGTTTNVTTYSESSLTTANANPIVCDSAGRASIFLTGGQTYRFDVNTSASVLVYSIDNISPVGFHTLASTTFGTGAAADVALVWDGNAQDFHVGLDDSVDDLVFGLGSVLGTTPAFAIDENQVTTFSQDPIITGGTPQLTIGDAGEEDTFVVWDGNAQDFYACLDDTADDWVIGLGSTCGTNPAITIQGDGTEDVALSGDLTVTGVGPHGIGGTATDYRQLNLIGSFTSEGSATNATKFHVGGTVTGATGDTLRLTYVDIVSDGLITQGATETISDVISVFIAEPNITVGSGDTITNATTLKIQGAPTEGTNDYAFWVDAGVNRFDDLLTGKGGTIGIDIDANGMVGIGETLNSNMQIGVVINQSTNDNEILAWKSSDVTHSFTGLTEPDTYGFLNKSVAASGGSRFHGFTSDATNAEAFECNAHIPDGGVDDTSTTAATGAFTVHAYVDDDATGREGYGVATVTGNLFVVLDADLAQFIVKEDGEIASNLAATVYDDYEDANLVRAFYQAIAPDKLVRTSWDDLVQYNEQTLIDTGILGAPLDENPMYSVTKLQMLHSGAIWQNNIGIRENTAAMQRFRQDYHNELRAVRLELAALKGQLDEATTPRLVAAAGRN